MNSCKKGENDPFFSFRTRKARVTGYWDFANMDRQAFTKLPNGEFYNETLTLADENINLKIDSTQTSHDTSYTISGKVKEAYYKFEKDGRLDYLLRYELTDPITKYDEITDLTTYEKTITTIEIKGNGTWNFLNKIDNYKNKERLSLVFESLNHKTTISYTIDIQDADGISVGGFPQIYNSVSNQENKWANGEFAQVWVLDMLKNKELHMYRQLDNLDLSSYYSSIDPVTSSSTTTIGLESVILKQE
jgi:hypothetical protein